MKNEIKRFYYSHIIRSKLEKYNAELFGKEEYLGACAYDAYGIDPSLWKKDVIKLEGDRDSSLPLLIKKDAAEDGCINLIYNSSCETEDVLASLKNVFRKYDAWESELNSVLMRGGSLDEYLNSSYGILENSLSVCDGNSRYLALAGAENLPAKYKYVKDLEFIEPKMLETPEDFTEIAS